MRLSREQARHCRLWNFIAIDANATKAAEDVPHVGYVAADGARIPDPRHPLAQLFRDVNSVDWWQSFAHEMYLMWGLFRRVVIWMNPNGFGLPAELWVIPTTWAEPVVDRMGTVTGWRITPSGDGVGGRVSGGAPFEIDADEILCAQAKHPTSKSIPLSPTEAGAEWIVSSEIIERARSRTYENGPLQSVLLEIDPEHHQGVTPELMEAIGEKFMARYQGWHQAGRPIVQPPGVRAVPWSVKPSEMLTGEQADQLRDNVLALHRTPRSAVGISSDLNRASIWGAEHNWYEHALNPMRRFLAGALTEFLASRYEAGLAVWYDDLVPRDQENERAEVELDFRLGAITPDERRRARGYDPLGIPESQKPYRQASLVPLDTPVQPGTPKEFSTRPERDEDSAGSGDEEDDPAAGGFRVRSEEREPDGGEDESPGPGEVRGIVGAGAEGCPVHAARDAAAPRVSQGVTEQTGDAAETESFEGDEPDPVETALAEDFQETHTRAAELLVRRADEFFRLLAKEIEARVDAGALVAEDLCPDAIVRTGFQTALTPGWRAVAELGVEFERRSLARGERAGADRIAQAAKRTKPAGGKGASSGRGAADETAPRVRRQIDEWIAEQQESEWKHVARATRREIAAAVKDGIAEGVTAKVLKSRLRRIVTDAGRAKGLAETEATKGLNKGAQLHRDSKGIQQKQWVSRGGSRSTHAAAHGQVTGNDGVFTVGGYRMKHPGDTSLGAPASEVARCRCFATGKIRSKRRLPLEEHYARVVASNRPWSWAEDIPGGKDLTAGQRRAIRQNAIAKGLVPKVEHIPGTKFADFRKAGLVIRTDHLPKDLWLATDKKQFDWLDARIPGGRPPGTTWHHSEIDGQMELVPFGPHNIIQHRGGRSPGMWSHAPRRKTKKKRKTQYLLRPDDEVREGDRARAADVGASQMVREDLPREASPGIPRGAPDGERRSSDEEDLRGG